MSTPPFVSDSMEMVLESDLESIERVVDETESFLRSRITDEELRYKIVLLATEAVTNAIEHGNQLDSAKRVHYRLDIRDSAVEVVVQDEGTGFNPAETEDPRESKNLMRDGGRGILFMKSLADEVRFEDEGRRVRLTFHAA